MAYCTPQDINSVLSSVGVTLAVDDDRTGTNNAIESQYVADAIARADETIKFRVMKWYDLILLEGNEWVKWCSAYLAAYELMTRRGEAAPNGLYFHWQRLMADLHQISEGNAEIPGATPKNDTGGGVVGSSMMLDQRYRVAKLRAVPSLSVGPQQSVLPRYVARIVSPNI